MTKKLKILCTVVPLGLCTIYLLFPNPNFPLPPANVLRSLEPGDTESIYRRAYYTNYTRAEIMSHYSAQFQQKSGLIQFRLNHPPEEAYALIRDQTRSNYLEQLVHPLRASLYINGYEPTKPSDQINRNSVHYANKITVRLVPSGPLTRLTVFSLIAISVYILTKEYVKTA